MHLLCFSLSKKKGIPSGLFQYTALEEYGLIQWSENAQKQ